MFSTRMLVMYTGLLTSFQLFCGIIIYNTTISEACRPLYLTGLQVTVIQWHVNMGRANHVETN